MPFALSGAFPSRSSHTLARIDKSVLVPYSAAQMFALVERVEDYPKFLPWCSGASVSRNTLATYVAVEASVSIDFLGLTQTFSTHNRDFSPERIELKLKDGPFRLLEGAWHFKALNKTACKVHLQLDYEFASAVLESLVGPVFNTIATTLVDSFTQRAESVYG
jgi:ribosome-associated toxin RatA of RatAB toxin-antitoxin module